MQTLYNTFIRELNDLSKGHPYNLKRLAYMRSIISVMIYFRYAVLSDKEVLKITQSYEYV